MMTRVFKNAVLIAVLSAAAAHAQAYFFMQMSDPQFGMYTDNAGFVQETINFEFAIATANRLKPAFVVITGDLVNQSGNRAQIAEFKRIAAKLDHSIPLYAVPGNHDVGNEPTPESLAAYREQFGRDYYSFRSHDMAGFVLNGNLLKAPGKVAEEAERQEKWLASELAKARDEGVKRLVVFLHQSLFLENPGEPDKYFNIPAETRGRYLELLHKYGVEHVYAGHYHRNAYGRDGALEMITTGPVGKPMGPEGSGIRIVTVKDGVFESKYYGFGFMPASVN